MEKLNKKSTCKAFLASLLFMLSAGSVQAACTVTPNQTTYNNGDIVTVTATNDAGGDWAVCIYSGGKLNGGTNLPVGRSMSDTNTTKTASAAIDTSTDYAGWRAVVLPGNGCNSTYPGSGVVCETPISAPGTAAPADDTADDTTGGDTGDTTGGNTDDTSGDADTRAEASAATSVTIANPISTDDFTELVTNFLQWLLGIAGSIALLMLIYGGITYITSAGDQQKAETGKKIVMWTLFGLIIILASYSIIKVIEDIFVS